MKVFFDHEILSFWTYEKRIKSDCWFYKLFSGTFQKNESQCEGKKSSSWNWPCELHEEHSLLEINCSLWHSEVKVTNYFDLVDVSKLALN